ncbi:predicted protein [Botrytis cinerea T4]|uniref:Uncharacterized protein n=1 Tax=Botryotinia fuckeliana (strain T4) TaxID=999810 RepID=G2YPV4_BOTF4|nr:predicted protein [Botrytis cinerea T4]
MKISRDQARAEYAFPINSGPSKRVIQMNRLYNTAFFLIFRSSFDPSRALFAPIL